MAALVLVVLVVLVLVVVVVLVVLVVLVVVVVVVVLVVVLVLVVVMVCNQQSSARRHPNTYINPDRTLIISFRFTPFFGTTVAAPSVKSGSKSMSIIPKDARLRNRPTNEPWDGGWGVNDV